MLHNKIQNKMINANAIYFSVELRHVEEVEGGLVL